MLNDHTMIHTLWESGIEIAIRRSELSPMILNVAVDLLKYLTCLYLFCLLNHIDTCHTSRR